MTAWLKQIGTWPKQVVVLVCILFITLMALVDFVTGYEMFFFTFYLLAIFWGTWRVSTLIGVLLSALSVTAWISSNIEAGAHYSSYIVPVWNAAIMFTIYVIVVLLLGRLRKIHSELEERVRLRTNALTHEIQERVRLEKEWLESGDREQRRIGRELHDGLSQHLTGTALAGHLLAQKLGGKSAVEAGEAGRLVQLIEEAIEMTRTLSHELDPVELKSGLLEQQLEDLAVGTAQEFKVSCRLDYHLKRPLDGALAIHLYRIAQQAVGRAARRPDVRKIDIGLDSASSDVVLTITDDGMVAPEERVSEMETEKTMNLRADLIGAVLKLELLADRGARLTCVVPAVESNHAAQN